MEQGDIERERQGNWGKGNNKVEGRSKVKSMESLIAISSTSDTHAMKESKMETRKRTHPSKVMAGTMVVVTIKQAKDKLCQDKCGCECTWEQVRREWCDHKCMRVWGATVTASTRVNDCHSAGVSDLRAKDEERASEGRAEGAGEPQKVAKYERNNTCQNKYKNEFETVTMIGIE